MNLSIHKIQPAFKSGGEDRVGGGLVGVVMKGVIAVEVIRVVVVVVVVKVGRN